MQCAKKKRLYGLADPNVAVKFRNPGATQANRIDNQTRFLGHAQTNRLDGDRQQGIGQKKAISVG